MHCGTWTISGIVEDPRGPRQHFESLGCKRWGCPECGPRKGARLRRAIREQAAEHGLDRVLTLTLDPKKLGSEVDPNKYIRDVWCKFRVYLARKLGSTPSYILVLEYQKTGMPHFHILLNRFVAQKWISQAWDTLGGGEICDIKRFDSAHRAAFYVSKYITKSLNNDYPPGVRRYSTSRDIRLFEKLASSGWMLIRVHIEYLARYFRLSILDMSTRTDGSLRAFRTPPVVEWLQ